MGGTASPRAPGSLRTILALAGLGAAGPANLAVTALALLTARVARPAAPPHDLARRTVMVSGGKMTKALHLCRSFHADGHRVVLVESAKYRLTGHRFSRTVDAFHVVPEPTSPDYATALLEVVELEGVDVYVPVCSPAASLPDAEAKALLEPTCEVLHPSPAQVAMLDDKYAFNRYAADLGLTVPDTHRITDPQEVLDFDFDSRSHPYVLKSIAYDPVHRLDLTPLPFGPPAAMETFVRALPISATNPWILQEFVEGTEYCTHSTVRDGRLTAYCCCESSAVQLNYAAVDRPLIREWVTTLVGAMGLTGQVAFDFIETSDGTPYAIECNPRTHSAITLFHDHPGLAAAYLDPDPARTVVEPPLRGRPTYWLYNEAWKLLRGPHRLEVLRTIWTGKDAIFDRRDPLPFLLVHHLQIPALLLANLRRGATWVRIDVNIGKLVEPDGD
jgi:glutathione synthase/RimK-type ligase-like ATP-grasp enzyme